MAKKIIRYYMTTFIDMEVNTDDFENEERMRVYADENYCDLISAEEVYKNLNNEFIDIDIFDAEEEDDTKSQIMQGKENIDGAYQDLATACKAYIKQTFTNLLTDTIDLCYYKDVVEIPDTCGNMQPVTSIKIDSIGNILIGIPCAWINIDNIESPYIYDIASLLEDYMCDNMTRNDCYNKIYDFLEKHSNKKYEFRLADGHFYAWGREVISCYVDEETKLLNVVLVEGKNVTSIHKVKEFDHALLINFANHLINRCVVL